MLKVPEMPDGRPLLSSEMENLLAAQERYRTAIRELHAPDGVDAALRRELEQALEQIESKLTLAAEMQALGLK